MRLLLVRHCDYGPILHRFSDTVIYWLKVKGVAAEWTSDTESTGAVG